MRSIIQQSRYEIYIDEKLVPIDIKKKLILATLILLFPIGLSYFLSHSPNNEKIETLKKQVQSSTDELNKVRKAARDLPRHERELQETREIFELTSILLPKSQEIPDLLRNISDLGKQSGLDFLTFVPGIEITKDFYAEIPIDIKIRGPYHNLGLFLDKVSKLNRVVSVNNIKTEKVDQDGGETLLTSSCRLVTYRFTNQKIELPKK